MKLSRILSTLVVLSITAACAAEVEEEEIEQSEEAVKKADDTTIAELETVLAWALKQELPRGSLAQRIEQAGGIDGLLNGA